MSIEYHILGQPGFDNCLFLRIDTGNSVEKLLFDCGEGCLDKISVSQLRGIDYLFFSHFHMDHISGFDYYFRRAYHRREPVYIFVPPFASDVIHSRFRGFTWNLDQPPGTWFVTECFEDKLVTYRFEKHELFEHKHFVEERDYNRTILDQPAFYVDAVIMNHKTPTLSFCLREKPVQRIDEKKLQKLNLSKGSWLQSLKDPEKHDSETVYINKNKYTLGSLRKDLLKVKKTESIAYLSDFRLDEKTAKAQSEMIQGCQTILCESMYANEDIEYAERNCHLIAKESASVAKKAGARKLFLIHISERYNPFQVLKILEQAREVFPKTFFPKGWREKLRRNMKK